MGEPTWSRSHRKSTTAGPGAGWLEVRVCLPPNPFSHVLPPARRGESSVEGRGSFWLSTADPAGPCLKGLLYLLLASALPVPRSPVQGWTTKGAAEGCSLDCSSQPVGFRRHRSGAVARVRQGRGPP